MKKILLAAALGSALALTACGEAKDDTPALPDTAEGLWHGSLTLGSDSSYRFHTLVTPDSALWMIYTTAGGSLAGVVQGNGSSTVAGHTYSAATLTERAATAAGTPYGGSATGAYTAQSKFSGVILTDGGARTLSFNPGNAVDYDSRYTQGLLLPTTPVNLPGRTLTPAGLQPTTLTIDTAAPADAVLSGTIGAAGSTCPFTSSLASPGRKSFFVVGLVFDTLDPDCASYGLSGSAGGVLFLEETGRTVIIAQGATLAFLEDPLP